MLSSNKITAFSQQQNTLGQTGKQPHDPYSLLNYAQSSGGHPIFQREIVHTVCKLSEQTSYTHLNGKIRISLHTTLTPTHNKTNACLQSANVTLCGQVYMCKHFG